MKIKFHLLTAILAISTPLCSMAQTDGDYRSVGANARIYWNQQSSWEKYSALTSAWIPNSGTPSNSTKLTTILSGDTMINPGTYKVQSLTINSNGAAIARSNGLRGIRVYASDNDSSIITNNGLLGGDTSDGNMRVEFQQDSTYYIMQGTGTTKLSYLRFSDVGYNAINIILNQDMELTYSGVAFTGYANGSGSLNTDSVRVTIMPGKVVKLTGENATFHMNKSNTSNAGGKYFYDIMGTLDMSTSMDTTMIPANSVDATSLTAVRIGGKLILGQGLSTVNSDPSTTMGKVTLSILSGGMVSATKDSVLDLDGHVFVMQDSSAILKRYVEATEKLFPIGTSDTVVNSVRIKNTGTLDTISVSVKNEFTDAAYSALSKTKTVNKTWYLKEATAGGSSLALKLAFVKADMSSAFVANTNQVSLYVYTGKRWKEIPTTVTGSGTMADPYWAAATGNVDSFQKMFIGMKELYPTAVKNLQSFASQVTIAPNPVVNHVINVNMTALQAGNYTASVYNIIGQCVSQATISHTTGSTLHTINLPAQIAPGVYQVQLSSKDGILTKKIVVE